jgi:hypothetical protein
VENDMATGFRVSGELVDDEQMRVMFEIYNEENSAAVKQGVITFDALKVIDKHNYGDPLQIFDASRDEIASKGGDLWLGNPQLEQVILWPSDFQPDI